MKYTLLDLTQNILSSMDSEEINSIDDNTEARQVANVIRTAYYNMVVRANPPESKKLFQLNSSGDDAQPTLMIRPDTVSRIEWIKYNKETVTEPQDVFTYITILPLSQYLELTHQLNIDDTAVDSMTLDGNLFYFKNDAGPCYCTIVNDRFIVFDSYDQGVDTTLQSSKTMCFGQVLPAFELVDLFVPELDDQQFPLLLNEAKALAFFELKQQPHEKAEQESRRQWRTLQRTKSLEKQPWFDALPDFGRRPSYSSPNRWMHGS